MVISLLEEIYSPTLSLFFSPNHENEKGRLYDNKIKTKLEELSKFIGGNDTTIGYLTLADFKIAEASYYFEKLFHESKKNFEALVKVR